MSEGAIGLGGIGLGCMRLSTEPDRDDDRGIAVIHAALGAGATWLDTADAYCLDDDDLGHNERLVARALAAWDGDRARVRISTKGGLTRPGGRWVSDAKANQLRRAAAASAERTGVPDLYLLHAPDPAVPLETSVRALARVLSDGHARAIGLCNVSWDELQRARDHAPISAVQLGIGPGSTDRLLDRTFASCREAGIAVFAHRPLGGRERAGRLGKNDVVQAVAERRAAGAAEVVLAWLAGLDLVPLVGCARVDHADRIAAARALRLDAHEEAAIDEALVGRTRFRVSVTARRRDAPAPGADVVVVMGAPGAGKTTVAREHEARGYVRINRDDRGGALSALVPALESALEAGTNQVVLDNTYPTRARRAEVLDAAWRAGHAVRCLHVDTPLGAAQVNVCRRMLAVHGRLLDSDDLAGIEAPGAFRPTVQHQYARALERPTVGEGFWRVDVLRGDDREWGGTAPGVLFDLDLAVRKEIPAPDAVAALKACLEGGARLGCLGWRPGGGARSAEGALQALEAAVGGTIHLAVCPHAAGPPRCWCRPPYPGLGVVLIQDLDLDRARTVLVCTSPPMRALAEKLGVGILDGWARFTPPDPADRPPPPR